MREDVHNVFLNIEEFSEIHTINGKSMPVQVYSNEQIEREKRSAKNIEGIFTNQRLIYVADSDFGPMPKQGSLLTMDNRMLRVADAVDEDGIYSITLEANRA